MQCEPVVIRSQVVDLEVRGERIPGRDARAGSWFHFVVTVPIRQNAVINPNVMQASIPPETTVSIWPSRMAFHAYPIASVELVQPVETTWLIPCSR